MKCYCMKKLQPFMVALKKSLYVCKQIIEIDNLIKLLTMNCTNCGNKVDDITKECPTCGNRANSSKNYCYSCGRENVEEYNICSGCKTPLKASQSWLPAMILSCFIFLPLLSLYAGKKKEALIRIIIFVIGAITFN